VPGQSGAHLLGEHQPGQLWARGALRQLRVRLLVVLRPQRQLAAAVGAPGAVRDGSLGARLCRREHLRPRSGTRLEGGCCQLFPAPHQPAAPSTSPSPAPRPPQPLLRTCRPQSTRLGASARASYSSAPGAGTLLHEPFLPQPRRRSTPLARHSARPGHSASCEGAAASLVGPTPTQGVLLPRRGSGMPGSGKSRGWTDRAPAHLPRCTRRGRGRCRACGGPPRRLPAELASPVYPQA
jgi:hypothetical protein